MKLLEKKVAIVSGGANGIGKEVARSFAAEGAIVVVSDIDVEAGNALAAELQGQGSEAVFIKADVAVASEQEALVQETVKRFGGLHIACNNAGIAGPMSPIGEFPLDGWERVLGINLSGVFYGMRYQIPAMLASGGGSIVNVSAIVGQIARKNAGASVASKHGVVGLTKAAALEYADKNIRVNAVGPGLVRTRMLLDAFDETGLATLEEKIPLGRLGEPKEIAEMVSWLSSDKASYVTGSYFGVDGGYLAQ